MKRGFTLFLLVLFLLNVLGYYGVFIGLQFKNTWEMQTRFDNDDYTRTQEITIKVPLTIPYATDTREYSRVDGEFEHLGEVYRMVKQKLHHDTLYIVCVRDNNSKEIRQALADYVKTFTDKPVSEKSNSKTTQSLIKDYLVSSISLQQGSKGWQNVFTRGMHKKSYNSKCIQLSSPPPKA